MSSVTLSKHQKNDNNENRDVMLEKASVMEQHRSELQSAIFNNEPAYNLLADLFFQHQTNDIDISEIINTKYQDDNVVQDDSFVQQTPKQMTQQLSHIFDRNAFGADTILQAQHFLPGFLIQVSEMIWMSSQLDKQFRQLIKNLSTKLQNQRQQLVMDNSKLVGFIARKYAPTSLPFSDVLQEGTLGLIKAVDRYDPRRDIRFSTYASYWIRQTISRLVVRQEKIVRLPFGLAERASTVFDIMRTCYITENRWPTVNEIKNQCDLTEKEINTIISFYQATQTTSTVENSDNETVDIMEKLEQHQFKQPLDTLTESNLNDYLNQAVDSLSEKEASILTLRFGLKNHQEMTLQAVAEQMHVTRERIRQIQNEALRKLKQNFGFELSLYLEPNDI
jgi:RNA polymerase primary sigma factor